MVSVKKTNSRYILVDGIHVSCRLIWTMDGDREDKGEINDNTQLYICQKP